MKMGFSVICPVLLLLVVGFGASCGSPSLPEAPELDLTNELEALEQITPHLGDIDVGMVEIPLDLFDDIEFDPSVDLVSRTRW